MDNEELLHEEARDLMIELDEKYGRTTCLSLDEYEFKYKTSLNKKELERCYKLLLKF
jgi:hypothetical protein